MDHPQAPASFPDHLREGKLRPMPGRNVVLIFLTVSRRVAVPEAAALVSSGRGSGTDSVSCLVVSQQPPVNGPGATHILLQSSGAVLLGPDGAILQTGLVSSNADVPGSR